MNFELADSKHSLKGATHMGKLNDSHNISTTWVLNNNLTAQETKILVDDITAFCMRHSLEIRCDFSHHLNIRGTAGNFQKALDADMHQYQQGDHVYHASSESIKLPQQWEGKVENILGFNSNRVAHHYAKKSVVPHTAPTTFTPLQLATLYNFPTGLNGAGQKIGIIELGGGFVLSDITQYFTNLGITTKPNITAVSVDGAVNNPSDTSGANVEVILDIEVVASLVPNSSIFVYFSPNSDQGFYDAINMAINNGCGIISISWGGPENSWSSTTIASYNNLFQAASLKNITVLAAAGDSGSSDGEAGNNVDFPASSPYVLSCGGTSLHTNDSVTIASETVWNDNSTSSATGGGISTVFAKPSYQASVAYSLKMRGCPDFSANGDPNTGYQIYSAAEGGMFVVGGTSAVAPFYSGLVARINQSIGKNIGFIHPTIYKNPSAFHDITVGNNGFYSAGPGWDPCSGLGSPNGHAILALFSSSTPTPPPPTVPAGPVPVSAFSDSTHSVTFTNNSTGATSWLWNFGDGQSSTLQNPTHLFQNYGNFTISLTSTNSHGSSTVSHQITI